MMAAQDPDALGEPVVNSRAPTAVDRAVGARIRRLRRANGLTLRGLGSAIGVSAVQFQRYETGASRVAASRLIAIADALGIPIETLLTTPRDVLGEAVVERPRHDVAELVRIFGEIRDPAHRSAILAFVRAMAPPIDAPLVLGPPFTPNLPGGLNGIVPADKS
jgi:transcriptional regulator with XRE-family HTH domain